MKTAAMIVGMVLAAAVIQAQAPVKTPLQDSTLGDPKDAPHIKIDTKGNVTKTEGKAKADSTAKAKLDTVTTASGLKYIDTKVGTGRVAEAGKMVNMHYTGWHGTAKGTRGKKYDSTVDRKSPISILLGRGMLVKGWEEGMLGMKVGGTRTLIIKPELGFGANGFRDMIPPNTTMIIDVELLDVSEPQRAH
jgi:FKBP-type peptidyl-prolyl cis-trans isomerase